MFKWLWHRILYGIYPTKFDARVYEMYKQGVYDGKMQTIETHTFVARITKQLQDAITEHENALVRTYNEFDDSLRESHVAAMKEGSSRSSEEAMKQAVARIKDVEEILIEVTRTSCEFLDRTNKGADKSITELVDRLNTVVNDVVTSLERDKRAFSDFVTENKDVLNESIRKGLNSMTQGQMTLEEGQEFVSKKHEELLNSINDMHKVFADIIEKDRAVSASERDKAFSIIEEAVRCIVELTNSMDLDLEELFTPRIKKIIEDLDASVKGIKVEAEAFIDTSDVKKRLDEIAEYFATTIKESHKAAADEGVLQGAQEAIKKAVEQMLDILDVRTLYKLAQEKEREENR